jgi:hypothetical protein
MAVVRWLDRRSLAVMTVVPTVGCSLGRSLALRYL